MGQKNGPYKEDFPVGTSVRIVDRKALESFNADRDIHHPLQAIQLPFAGRSASIKGVTFYHGGDELYELDGIPGIWHERCLTTDVPAPQ